MNKQVQGAKDRFEAAKRDAISSFLKLFGAQEGDWGILRALRSPIHSPSNSDVDDDFDHDSSNNGDVKRNLRKRKMSTSATSTSTSNNGSSSTRSSGRAKRAKNV